MFTHLDYANIKWPVLKISLAVMIIFENKSFERAPVTFCMGDQFKLNSCSIHLYNVFYWVNDVIGSMFY